MEELGAHQREPRKSDAAEDDVIHVSQRSGPPLARRSTRLRAGDRSKVKRSQGLSCCWACTGTPRQGTLGVTSGKNQSQVWALWVLSCPGVSKY